MVVEGINISRKATRPNQTNPSGGFVDRPSSINMSNVAAVDPEGNVASRVGFSLDGGNKIRIAKRSGQALSIKESGQS